MPLEAKTIQAHYSSSVATTNMQSITATQKMKGTLALATVLSIWVCSAFIIPLWLHFFGWRTLVLYYVYRWFFPVSYWPAFHRFMKWMDIGSYFDQHPTLHAPSEKVLRERPFMICHHPHGVFAVGFNTAYSTSKDFNIRVHWIVFFGAFFVPIAAELWGWMGSAPSSRWYMEHLMKRSQNVALIPGGLEECTITTKDKDRLYIKRRFGFIRLALKYGYRIFPSYTFGETSLYWTCTYGEKFRLWLNSWNFPASVLMFGVRGFLPDPTVKLRTVVGEPLDFPTIEDPTKEEIQMYLHKYISSLKSLVQKHSEEPQAVEVM
eukprot:GILJ01005274.1.p1 GENE.GILJ01005274.1~~GILJ01005274.1.p1  ORF type:complete len:320 (+),score=31.08 GILJ01005274.1:86-1045(+)